jgi:hypothetical protein
LRDPKPELAIILLYLVVATIVSFPYQKWRMRSSASVAPIQAGDKL